MLERIWLSPDFPLIFTISVIILFVVALKLIDVINNSKSRKLLEMLNEKFSITEGEDIMKNLFENAVSEVDAKHQQSPVSGNEKTLTETFARLYKRSEEQGFGLAQLMSLASFAKHANKQQKEMDDIISSVRDLLAKESNHFDEETKKQVENALGGPQELITVLEKIQNDASPQKEETPQEEDTPQEEEIPQEEENLPILSSDEAKHIIMETKALHSVLNGLLNEDFSFDKIPEGKMFTIRRFFEIRKDPQSKQMFQFLQSLTA